MINLLQENFILCYIYYTIYLQIKIVIWIYLIKKELKKPQALLVLKVRATKLETIMFGKPRKMSLIWVQSVGLIKF
ncbi:hypothetical protein BpHYR1_027515 [Brachionus plicatilis]|uniref:Uncharacterized protein n=1 Tax=Brachionus plicatilis TaxID=10195 RepID=A0A3M7RYG0_BRAPC|nr:hypothetical protein BpHYR1_027515 [Brachionus plicatilis]